MCEEGTLDQVLAGSPDFVFDAIDNIDTKAWGAPAACLQHAASLTRAAHARVHSPSNCCDVHARTRVRTAWAAGHTPRRRALATLPLMQPQVALLAACKERGIPVLSSAGAGAKVDPTRLRIVDVSESSIDPLARAVRQK